MQNKFAKYIQVYSGDLGGSYFVPRTEADAGHPGMDKTVFPTEGLV